MFRMTVAWLYNPYETKFYFVSHKNLKYKAYVLFFCKTHLTGHGQVKLVS